MNSDQINLNSCESNRVATLKRSTSIVTRRAAILYYEDALLCLNGETLHELADWIKANIEAPPKPTIMERYKAFAPGTRFKFQGIQNAIEYVKINDELVYNGWDSKVHQTRGYAWGDTSRDQEIFVISIPED